MWEDKVMVVMDKPHLEQVQNASLGEEAEKTSSSEIAVDNTAHDNQTEFEKLRAEDRRIAFLYALAVTAVTGALALTTPVLVMGSVFSGSVSVTLILNRTQKIHSILRHGEAIDTAFKHLSPEIFCDLPIPDQGRLDMLIKFPLPPKKAIFAIALRTRGNATVSYREEQEALYVRSKRGGGAKLWTPDHIERLGTQGFWLRQNRGELFGQSRRDKNRSVIKLLVLTGQTKFGKNPDHLYTQVGDEKVLLIQRKSSIFVLEERQLLGFIKGCLSPPG